MQVNGCPRGEPSRNCRGMNGLSQRYLASCKVHHPTRQSSGSSLYCCSKSLCVPKHVIISYRAIWERDYSLDGLPQGEVLSPRGRVRCRDNYKTLDHLLVHVCNSPCNFTTPTGKKLLKLRPASMTQVNIHQEQKIPVCEDGCMYAFGMHTTFCLHEYLLTK